MEHHEPVADGADAALRTAEEQGGTASAGAMEAGRPNEASGGRRQPLRVREGDGLLFVNGDATMRGALNLGGETFQCTVRPAGSSHWTIAGQGDRGDAISGKLFREAGDLTPAGRFRPRITGHVTTVAGRARRRVAGWPRTSASAAFFSLKLTAPPQDEATMMLPLDLPILRAPSQPGDPT